MAKRDSTVSADEYVLALSIDRRQSEDDGCKEMRVSTYGRLSCAIAAARHWVKSHPVELEFAGADIWLDGELLVFTCGAGEGADVMGWALGECKRFFPSTSGCYTYDEVGERWLLVGGAR